MSKRRSWQCDKCGAGNGPKDATCWGCGPTVKQPDLVNQPPHYKERTPEPITVIEGWGLGYHLGNAVKYIARADYKGKRLEDLKKARWYLDREIERGEK